MAQNKMFPLDVLNVEKCALIAKISSEKLWHLCYGHLHEKGLKLLAQKNMVVGLSIVDSIGFCKDVFMGNKVEIRFL